MVDRCPHCFEDIGYMNNKQYALHVENCYAKNIPCGEKLQKIREANI